MDLNGLALADAIEASDALMVAQIDLDLPPSDGSHPGEATTTHEQLALSDIPEADWPGGPMPRALQVSPPVRAAWEKFRAAERRFSQSLWGDALAGICFCILFLGALFAPLFIPV